MVLCWWILQYVAVGNMLQSIMLWVMTLYSKMKDAFFEVDRIIPNIGSCDCHRMDSPENGLWSRTLWAGSLLGKCPWDLTCEGPGKQEWAEGGAGLWCHRGVTVSPAELCWTGAKGTWLWYSIVDGTLNIQAALKVFLPGESQGWGKLVGCHLWGRTESDTTEVT